MTSTKRRRTTAVAAVLVCLTTPRFASAQAGAAASEPMKGYAEAVAQSAFGNVTSQAYGGEFGVRVWRTYQLFVEGGEVRNASSAAVSSAAQVIAAALGQLQPAAVDYSVKEPVSFFAAGVRVPVQMPDAKIIPYVLGGFGAARIKKNVTFTFGGEDASASLAQYVTLGEDLTGSKTVPMLTLGAGAMWPVWHQVVVDFQFRFGRLLDSDEGRNIGRAGIGLGVKF